MHERAKSQNQWDSGETDIELGNEEVYGVSDFDTENLGKNGKKKRKIHQSVDGEIIKLPPKPPTSPPIFVVFGKGTNTDLKTGRVVLSGVKPKEELERPVGK